MALFFKFLSFEIVWISPKLALTESATSPFSLRNHFSSHTAGGCEEQSWQGPDRSTLWQTFRFVLIIPWNRKKVVCLFCCFMNCVKRSKSESNRCFSPHFPPTRLRYASCSPTVWHPLVQSCHQWTWPSRSQYCREVQGFPGSSLRSMLLKPCTRV